MPDVDARTWLYRDRPLAETRFESKNEALRFIDQLHAAGAISVFVRDMSTDQDVPYSELIVVTLPADHDARARLFAIFNREVDEYGEDFGGEEPALSEVTESEAEDIGDENAVGSVALEDPHVHETGQTELKFWWN